MFTERIEDAKYINLLEGDERMIVKRSLRFMFYVGVMTGIFSVALMFGIAYLMELVI